MCLKTAYGKVNELIAEYGFWEAAKSHILKMFNEDDKSVLITVGTEMMIERFRNTSFFNIGI